MGSGEDKRQLVLLKEIHYDLRRFVGCIILHYDVVITPVLILLVKQLDEVAEVQLHHAGIGVDLS